MRDILVLAFLVSMVCIGFSFASTQTTGGDFGKNWLEIYSSPKIITDGGNDLWAWGGTPRGYVVEDKKLIPLAAPSEWFYPMIMMNSTPLVVSETNMLNNQYYLSPDFDLPDLSSDPWFLAQVTGRPVKVNYPVKNRIFTLL